MVDPSPLQRLVRATAATLSAEGHRIQRDLQCGRHLFVTLHGQKPFYCDMESVLALEVLAHELRTYAGPVRLSEMIPGPDDLWLDLGDGARTSELRFMATVDGDRHTGCGYHLPSH
jgi:hypothetical protein